MNDWQYSAIHNSACKVIEEQTLWGQTVCRVWLPNQDAVVRVPLSALRPLDSALQPGVEAQRIIYVAAAAKVAEVLEGCTDSSEEPVLLAPMESNVIPLPHQLHALSLALSGDRVRYLLADEVGLGKTIEAGLVMRELKLRGLVGRTLVVAPKGLATQWVSEMRTHFNESFQLVLGDDLATMVKLNQDQQSGYWAKNADLIQIEGADNPWTVFNQVVVSLDSVKPVEGRRGWSRERTEEYNRLRFEELMTAGWDLVIIDEAHRLGGSTDQVARYKLGRGLAEAAPYLLLLSATPHQGKSDAFHRLVSLLDRDNFPAPETVTRGRIAPFVIRTEKRNAIDTEGKPLFKPRRTRTVPVRWEARHQAQRLLYEAVTEYVREGYNQALREKKRHIGFLMLLMQRLVVSSTRAIRNTLERRLEVLLDGEQRTNLRLETLAKGEEAPEAQEELYDLDGQELLDELLTTHGAALQNEAGHVERLLDAARNCEQSGPDAKAEALSDALYQLQAEESESDLKVLLFTEFVATQEMLAEFLEARGIKVVTLNGSMDMVERKRAQDAFRDQARVLVSTDAGGEGLNLQFCHAVINYDLPWNPMRLEQRIGRVDRIGQTKPVRALNFLFEESVEFRVREVLERKLAVIFEEFGIDKTGDVLDSVQAGELFEEVFVSAFLKPEDISASVEQTVAKLREDIQVIRESSALYGLSDEPDVHSAERLRSHPLPHWVERMTVSYLNSHGGSAIRKHSCWELAWPDGHGRRKGVFNFREAERLPDATLFNLENNRIRGLALNLPQLAAGQPLPCVTLDGLPPGISGLWGLFEVRLQAGATQKSLSLRIPQVRRGYVSVFLSEEGKLFLPTARHLWDALQTTEPKIVGNLRADKASVAYERLLEAAEQAGQELFNALRQRHSRSMSREEERGQHAFDYRRKAIERLGLHEVRQHRLKRCALEESEWRQELESARQIVPEIRPLLMLRIIKGGAQ